MKFACLRKLFYVAVATCCIGAALPAVADEIVVQHSRGETRLPERPKTVVAFDLSAIDTLSTLGVAVAGMPRIAALPAFLKDRDLAAAVPVGTLFEPDYEAVAALRPDLIIVGGRSAAKYDDLAKIAPTVDLSLDDRAYLKSAEANIATLARLFGKEDLARGKLAALNAAVDALKAKTAGAGSGLMVLTTGGRMSTFGAGSRFGILFTDFGMKQVNPDIKIGLHGQPVSFEYILAQNPDWLFVLDRDAAIGREGEAAKALLDNALVGETTAWKRGQVVYLDAAAWYLVGGGLTALQVMTDQLNGALGSH
ncbi:siderophore ABC transporter substrate-binding protein [Pseudoxanthobacter sp.]|uniref:siderophore ABC transporter substrate-binding protein n=1 Tax=Pseudoxanthobacter sp. TaxID=1925742 RepID=UPI002FE006A6